MQPVALAFGFTVAVLGLPWETQSIPEPSQVVGLPPRYPLSPRLKLEQAVLSVELTKHPAKPNNFDADAVSGPLLHPAAMFPDIAEGSQVIF